MEFSIIEIRVQLVLWLFTQKTKASTAPRLCHGGPVFDEEVTRQRSFELPGDRDGTLGLVANVAGKTDAEVGKGPASGVSSGRSHEEGYSGAALPVVEIALANATVDCRSSLTWK